MKPHAGLRLKTHLLILLMIVFGPLGDVLLSKGMKRIGPVGSWAPANLIHFFSVTFRSSLVWLGIGSLFFFSSHIFWCCHGRIIVTYSRRLRWPTGWWLFWVIFCCERRSHQFAGLESPSFAWACSL